MTQKSSRLDRREFLTRSAALAAAAPSLAGLAAACGGGDTPSGEGGTLVVGIPKEPLPLDVVTMTWADESSLDIYERLIIRNYDGEYVGQLARNWEVSDDQTTYTLKLRPNKRFHDGVPVTASAVKRFFDTIRDPKSGYIFAGTYYNRIETISAPDDATIVFQLSEPDFNLLFGLSHTYAGVQSIAAREKAGDNFTTKVVGSGPFSVREWVAADRVSLVRNDRYRGGGPLFANQGAAHLEGVTYKYLSEPASRAANLETGSVHVVRDIPVQDIDRLKGADGVRIVTLPSWDVAMFMFNLELPKFKDVRVRRAIAQAIDKQAIVDVVLRGEGKILNSPIVPQAPEHWSGSLDLYAHDPQAARSLLESAGWRDTNGDGIAEKDGKPFTTSLLVWSNTAQRQIAQSIEQSLSQIGIKVEIEVTDEASVNSRQSSGDFEMSTVDISWDDAFTISEAFFGSGGMPWPNFARYRNERVDRLYSQARGVSEFEERRSIAREVQEILLNDMPAVFLFTPDQVYGIREEVQRYRPYEWSLYPYLIDTSLAE